MRLNEVKSYGFPISKHLWSSKNENPRKPGGAKPISPELQQSIRTYLKEKSNIASNRRVINKDPNDEDYLEDVNARYLENNKIELYNSFKFRDQVARSTFYRYVNKSKVFKNPHRLTDMCDYCEKALTLKDEIVKNLKTLKYEFQEFNLDDISKYITKKNKEIRGIENNEEKEVLKNTWNKILNYQTIQFHKSIASSQREAYNSFRKDVEKLRGKILIDVDFKQKIEIGISPRQKNQEYYNKELHARVCLG